ncbi:hypothetical protein E1A91_A13G101900v1 [Gossypium mustelinum]|uniref:Ribosomal protein L10 n=1 Tax=Gossypium mustelinum TaxID=34275 RepID=A0A5D2WFR0_GOSMU|nr:hypothetical protein E1A91_A13G101900v1 [Gossypium mustelinum]
MRSLSCGVRERWLCISHPFFGSVFGSRCDIEGVQVPRALLRFIEERDRCLESEKKAQAIERIVPRASLLQKESLYRVSGEERSPEIPILFHSSGSTNNQWRKIKNPWFPGRTPFRPSCCGTKKKKQFFVQLAHSAGMDRLEFLPSWDSMDQDLLSLYGQYRSTLVDHMDIEKASDFDEF